MKRIISLILCFLMIINFFPVTVFAEEEQNLEEIIRPQIEAFAKSIDKPNAIGEMEKAIISHGTVGKGKKLSVGKNHAITATLMNSELLKECFTKTIVALLVEAKNLNLEEISSLGLVSWSISGKNFYNYYLYDYNSSDIFLNGKYNFPKDYFKKSDYYLFFSGANSYDESLELIVGGLHTDIDIKTKEKKDDKIVLDINVKLLDIFNFDTDNGSILEDLLGAFGMLFFKPFEWESKFNFQIEIPIEKPEENITFGDADGNGNIDIADAYFARLAAAKLVKPTEEQIAFCDVDGDGKITAIDANIIRKYAAGIIDKFPVQ